MDIRVRDEVAHALERFFEGSTGVTPHIIHAIEHDRDGSLALARCLKFIIPEENDIKDIVRLFNSIDRTTNNISQSLHYHLTHSLLSFPFELLQKNRDVFVFNNDLLKLYEIAENREHIKSRDHKYLWDELESLCKRFRDTDIKGDDHHYAELIIEGLCRYREDIKGKVIMHLAQEDEPENYHFEEFMMQLAGRLKIDETVPFLFRIFNETNYMHIAHNVSIKSLGRIGSREVVQEIEKLYGKNEDHKNALANMLESIPYDYCEDLALRLIKKEKDPASKTFLACALADIFSLKAVEILKNMLWEKQYDYEITALIDLLVPLYAYHNLPPDELSALNDFEQLHIKDSRKNSPLYKASENLRNTFASLTANQQDRQDDQERNRIKPSNVLSMRKLKKKIQKKMGKKK
ncbi:MAG: hypothetical protein WCQ99_17810 [Pseudomonadota bacterium]